MKTVPLRDVRGLSCNIVAFMCI